MNSLDQAIDLLRGQPLLALTLGAVVLSLVGAMIPRRWLVGRLLRGLAALGLLGAFGLSVLHVARLNGGFDVAIPEIGMPDQQVAGRETRVAMNDDGHFWITAEVNGVRARFLVDTGATVTALTPELAQRAELRRSAIRQPIILRTANGAVEAQVATIDELKFGNVEARDLDAVVAPNMGDVSVIGMNLLSRLASWRVEGRTMILVPHRPASPSAA